jgi:hypothetical protein
MKKMLKRADGSKSRRGLWDNIRANKGSGKEPTKEMLKQEKKIKSKGMGGPGDQGKPAKAASDTTTVPTSEMTKSAMAQLSKNLPATQEMLKAASNKKDTREDKLTIPSLDRANLNMEPKRKKSGGKSTWLMESKELKFGGPTNKKNKYLDGGPSMDTKTAVGQVFQGKMTAEQGQAAIGKTAKPAMTPEQKTEFMSKLKTYGKKTGGKKRMGGKNC